MQSLGLAASSVLIVLIAVSHRAAALSCECILLGIALAPFFPATFALLMRLKPQPRTAGFILAVSGLGAALFPWLMGVVSTRAGSLRVAMLVPATLAVVLLGLGRLRAASGVSPRA
jgi:fucose permease